MIARRAALLAGASAVAASCHEVVWSRLLARWVGNTAWAVGVTLGVFMLGLGLGAWLPALRPRLRARARRGYLVAEVAVALGGLFALALFTRATPPSALVRLAAGSVTALALDVAAGSCVLLLPALAMGATWPLLVTVASHDPDDPRALTRLYVAGLAGAVVGVLVGAGLVAPRYGFDTLGALACALNLAVALAAWRLLPASTTSFSSSATSAPPARDAALAFGFAGLFGLGAQALWNRVLVPYAGVSSFAFAAIVAVYVGAQALGGVFARRLSESDAQTWGARALTFAPCVCLLSLGAEASVSSWMPPRDGDALAWALATLAAVAVVTGPTAWLLGVAQTATLRALESDRDAWGSSAARVTGAGTVLSAVGALLGSLVFYPRLGPRAGLALLALPALVQAGRAGSPRLALGGALGLGLMLVLRPGPAHFLGREWDAAPALATDFGVQDTTAVVLHDQPVEPRIRRLVANGVSYSGDSLFAQRYMRLLAHLPALAARENRRALVICIGIGTTASALRAYDFAQIDAVDISPSVRDLLGWFEHVHEHLLDDARVHVITDDGDHFLRAQGPAYDVITLEPPPPRAPGASSLYSDEFYRSAARRLAPGGVVAQWLPLHDLTGWEAESLVATFAAVFPHATLHLAERNEAVLLSVGGASPAPPPRLERPAVRRDLDRIGLPDGDPLRETLLASLASAPCARTVRHAWPAPELAPLSLPPSAEPLSAWMDALVTRASPAAGTFAHTVGPAVPAFLRVLERAPRATDRAEVTRALARMLTRHPDNVYWQHVHGYGSYLADRLARARGDGLTPAEEALVRSRIEALRARAPR